MNLLIGSRRDDDNGNFEEICTTKKSEISESMISEYRQQYDYLELQEGADGSTDILDSWSDDETEEDEEDLVVAEWDVARRRYVVDPSKADCDVAGTVASGWWSEDGNDWLDFGGGDVAGDFDKVTIQFAGGPRDGTRVS